MRTGKNSVIVVLVFSAVLLLAAGCDDSNDSGRQDEGVINPECITNDDCPEDFECVSGVCLPVPPPDGTDTDADTDSDSDSDSDADDDKVVTECVKDSDCPSKGRCKIAHCDYFGRCIYEKKPDNEPCPDGVFCNGKEFCKNGECIENDAGPCPQLNACIDVECDEANDKCIETPKAPDSVCSETMFCFGNRPMRCFENVCVPNTLQNDCTKMKAPTQCMVYDCIEATDSCDLINLPDGTGCNDPDGGLCPRNGKCDDGHCYPKSAACPARHPCFKVACNPTGGGDAECLDAGPVGSGERCGDECMGVNSYCYGTGTDRVCVPDPAGTCTDDDITTREGCGIVDWKANCGDLGARDISTLKCDSTMTLPGMKGSLYRDAEYTNYNGTCSHTQFEGYEIPFRINHTGTVTVSVSNTNPSGEIRLLLLDDLGDPSSCSTMSVSSVSDTFTGTGDPGLIIELMTTVRFNSIAIQIECE